MRVAYSTARLRWTALVLLAAVEFMILLDIAIVNIETPAIQVSLYLAEADLPWIQNAYLLVIDGFLLLSGTNEHGTAARQWHRHLRTDRGVRRAGWRVRRPD